MLGRFSRVQLCDPMDCSLPGASVHGILQARILAWVAISSSRGSSQPRDQTHVFQLLQWQAGSLPLAPPGKPQSRLSANPVRATWSPRPFPRGAALSWRAAKRIPRCCGNEEAASSWVWGAGRGSQKNPPQSGAESRGGLARRGTSAHSLWGEPEGRAVIIRGPVGIPGERGRAWGGPTETAQELSRPGRRGLVPAVFRRETRLGDTRGAHGGCPLLGWAVSRGRYPGGPGLKGRRGVSGSP